MGDLLFVIELILPLAVFAAVWFIVFRLFGFSLDLENHPGRTATIVVSMFLSTLAIFSLMGWGFFSVYGLVAGKHGHSALGGSWDIRLTYSLTLGLLVMWGGLVCYVARKFSKERKQLP